MKTSTENLRWLRAEEEMQLPNMVLEQRTERRNSLGYDGVARDSDSVSADHFLPARNKARAVRLA